MPRMKAIMLWMARYYSVFPVVVRRLSNVAYLKTFSRSYSSAAITTTTEVHVWRPSPVRCGRSDRPAEAVLRVSCAQGLRATPPMLYPLLANFAKKTRGSGFQFEAIPQIFPHLRASAAASFVTARQQSPRVF
jgi:hypothetical protein